MIAIDHRSPLTNNNNNNGNSLKNQNGRQNIKKKKQLKFRKRHAGRRWFHKFQLNSDEHTTTQNAQTTVSVSFLSLR